jgi:hypothetical protein
MSTGIRNPGAESNDEQNADALKERFEGSYPEDDFGRPAGRNYRYLISLDNWKALQKVRLAEKLGDRWIHTETKDAPLACVHVHTRDKKGHIPGLAKYVHSPEWQDFPSGPGRLEGLEMRNASKGGTRIRGSVAAYFDIFGMEIPYVDVDFTVSATPTEITAAYDGSSSREDADAVIDEIEEELHWTLEDRYEELSEELYEEYGDDLEYY